MENFSTGLLIWQILIFFSIGIGIYCLVDILRNKFTENDKIIWILIVLLIPLIGSLLYLFIIKENLRIKK